VVDLSTFSSASLLRGRSRVVEAAWWIAKLLIVQSPIPWPSRVRKSTLKIFGAQIGRKFYIRPGVNIHFPWKLSIGDNVWIGERTTILNLEPVYIGSNVALAHEVYLTTGGHDIRSATFAYANAPIYIESGCWLATRCFVGPGVRIAENAVVAAGAVVVRDVEPWAIVAGVPARRIGTREIIQ
jgi:putative colanic acid biosynthesis acetyltransferase WcaF